MVKTNFLLDIGYFPTGLAETNEFVPSQNISPTFWETTQAQLGFNYDSQIEAFKEDLEFDTKGIARPAAYLFGLAGTVPPMLGQPEDFDQFKVLEDIKNAPPVPFDPDFNPFDQELIAGYEEHADYFADAKNLEHFNFKKRVIDENIKRREIIRLSGFFQNLGAAFFDPINFIALPFGGPTVGMARSAVRVGAGTGVIVAAQEATRYPFDPLATPGEVATSVAAASVFGGILGGFIGMPRTLQARKVRQTSDKFIKAAQKNNEDVDFATHAMAKAQVDNSGPRPLGDVLAPYNKAQVDDVLAEASELSAGIRMRKDLLRGNKFALERLARDAGDTVKDFTARLKDEIDDLTQRQKENSNVQRNKIFKDSRKLAEGKITEIKIGGKIYKNDEIEGLASKDQIMGNKKLYENVLPKLNTTLSRLSKKLETAKKKVKKTEQFIKDKGYSDPNQQQPLLFGPNTDEPFNAANKAHQIQLREYLSIATRNNKEVKTIEGSIKATENRIEEIQTRQADNNVALRNRRRAIDKQSELLDFDRNTYINSPLFKFVPTPIKSLLFDKTATGTAKYALLKIGHDSGIGLEMVKRGFKLGSSIFQRRKTHDGKIYDFILTMRSFYLRSVGMSDLRATGLFSMEQVEWQKLYQSATRRMGGGYVKSEQEFMHDVAVKYMKNEKGDTEFEQAAIDYMKQKFKDERIEKEGVGLLGGTDFFKSLLENKKLDLENRIPKRDKYVNELKKLEHYSNPKLGTKEDPYLYHGFNLKSVLDDPSDANKTLASFIDANGNLTLKQTGDDLVGDKQVGLSMSETFAGAREYTSVRNKILKTNNRQAIGDENSYVIQIKKSALQKRYETKGEAMDEVVITGPKDIKIKKGDYEIFDFKSKAAKRARDEGYISNYEPFLDKIPKYYKERIPQLKSYIANYEERINGLKDEVNELVTRIKELEESKAFGKEYLDDNFFPRNFDAQKIRQNQDRFINILTTELMKTKYRFNNKNKGKKGNMSEADARALAEQTTRRILHEEEPKVDEIFVGVGVSKHLKGRVLDIPNSKLIDFIHTNPTAVYKKYVQSTAGLVEFKREFGIFKDINNIRDDIFDSAIEAGHTIADAQRHFMNVRFMYDRVVTGRLHENPYTFTKKVVNVVRSGAQLNFLGSVIYSTMAEPATIMMNHGVGRTLYGLLQVLGPNKELRRTIDNIGKAGEAIDLTLGSSNNRFVSEMQMNSMGDHFLDKTKNVFYIMNGLTPVTTALKRLDGILRIDHFISAANRWHKGEATAFDKKYLLRYNINKADADKIGELVDKGIITKHQEGDKGLFLGDFDEWGDEALVDNFKSALSSGILNTILMGTPADKPKIVDGLVFLRTSTVNKAGLGGLFKESKDYPGYVKFDIPILGLPFQFFSYSFAALNKVTASIAQGTVKSRVMAPIIGIGLAYMALSMRKPDYVWDNMEIQDKMAQSIEYSGIAAIYMDLFYESLHTILAVNGVNITGGFLSPKYKDTPHEALIGILGAGPSHSLSVVHAIHEMIAGDFGKGMGDMLKLAPFAGLPYIKNHVKDIAYVLDEKFD